MLLLGLLLLPHFHSTGEESIGMFEKFLRSVNLGLKRRGLCVNNPDVIIQSYDIRII